MKTITTVKEMQKQYVLSSKRSPRELSRNTLDSAHATNPLLTRSELNTYQNQKREGQIGFVPTIGFLHEGHLSLVRKARQECDIVFVSIFVNPTQFGENEDFDKYPRDFEKDRQLLEKEDINVLFYPDVEEIYPNNKKNTVAFPSFKSLSTKLCGISRPNHFEGVCMAVKRLFDIIKPDKAYFGLKDYQQYLIIKIMVKELSLPIKIIGCPTIREEDGLAMSSRNSYLSKEERKDATVLYESLTKAKKLIENGEKDISKIKQEIIKKINTKKSIKIDYTEIVDSQTLENIDKIRSNILIAIAASIGKTRLIDNIIL